MPTYSNDTNPSFPSTLSMSFNGDNGYQLGDVIPTLGTDNFGMDAWVKPVDTSQQIIVYNGNNASNGAGLTYFPLVSSEIYRQFPEALGQITNC